MTNFKTQTFKGSLLELLEDCNPHLAHPMTANSFSFAHQWLQEQFDHIDANFIPVRKFGQFSQRGQFHSIENSNHFFIPVDNEPFCYFYHQWSTHRMIAETMKNLFLTKKVPVSWSCDVGDKRGMKFSGVSTPFRDRGLKLAHIQDAGVLPATMHTSVKADEFRVRFIRSLSPFNVFLFPGSASCTFQSNYQPLKKDWCEDTKIRQIAMSFLIEKLNLNHELFEEFVPDFHFDSHWKENAHNIHVTVTPKEKKAKKIA